MGIISVIGLVYDDLAILQDDTTPQDATLTEARDLMAEVDSGPTIRILVTMTISCCRWYWYNGVRRVYNAPRSAAVSVQKLCSVYGI